MTLQFLVFNELATLREIEIIFFFAFLIEKKSRYVLIFYLAYEKNNFNF